MSEGEESWLVEAIRGWRYDCRAKCIQYLIKWQNYPEEDNTWEPQEHLNCDDLLKQFERSLTDERKRFYLSRDHSKLTGFQRNATFEKSSGADCGHESDEEDADKVDKQAFYCLIKFEDSDLLEEVPLDEFMDHKPEEAFKFLERRILVVPKREDI